MPSIADTRKEVKQQLSAETDHDAILASLQDEIDRHNEATNDSRYGKSRSTRKEDNARSEDEGRRRKHLRFRFKSGVEEPKRKRSSLHGSSRKHRKTADNDGEKIDTAHPFPREPAPLGPDDEQPSNTHAFQSSLFDALADDEAAAYWESVYSQPVHIYPRPTQQTPSGKLESMDDETYATYVQRKMWEKAHPEVMIERDRMERKKQEEAEAKAQRKRDFLRQREREAWKRAGRAKETRKDEGGNEDFEYVFDFSDSRTAPDKSTLHKPDNEIYERAWSAYLAAWEALRASLADPPADDDKPRKAASKRIPWPTMNGKPATRPNIEDFMRHIPVTADGSMNRTQALKAERVRWHPDKVQQRFRGEVDEGTMKVVTGVFQVVDTLLEEERRKIA